jgi:hypothetical protein
MTDAPPPIPRLVIDTNVIYSRVLHELIGRLAREARVFDVVWSDELLAEAKRVLIANKPVDERSQNAGSATCVTRFQTATPTSPLPQPAWRCPRSHATPTTNRSVHSRSSPARSSSSASTTGSTAEPCDGSASR